MILVVQFRDDVTLEHEQQCVGKHLNGDHEVRFVSVFDGEVPFDRPVKLLEGVSKLVLGGSAGLSMGDGHSDNENDYQKVEFILKTVEPLVRHVLHHDFPTLGTCFGHQLLGHLAGGLVEFDESTAETGFFELAKTDEGRHDPLLAGVPERFWAIEGHQDTLTVMPPGAVQLVYSEKCPAQMIRFGHNVYGTQFHSELTSDDLLYRLRLFPQYTRYAESLEVVPTPFAVKVLENFLAMPVIHLGGKPASERLEDVF